MDRNNKTKKWKQSVVSKKKRNEDFLFSLLEGGLPLREEGFDATDQREGWGSKRGKPKTGRSSHWMTRQYKFKETPSRRTSTERLSHRIVLPNINQHSSCSLLLRSISLEHPKLHQKPIKLRETHNFITQKTTTTTSHNLPTRQANKSLLCLQTMR